MIPLPCSVSTVLQRKLQLIYFSIRGRKNPGLSATFNYPPKTKRAIRTRTELQYCQDSVDIVRMPRRCVSLINGWVCCLSRTVGFEFGIKRWAKQEQKRRPNRSRWVLSTSVRTVDCLIGYTNPIHPVINPNRDRIASKKEGLAANGQSMYEFSLAAAHKRCHA